MEEIMRYVISGFIPVLPCGGEGGGLGGGQPGCVPVLPCDGEGSGGGGGMPG